MSFFSSTVFACWVESLAIGQSCTWTRRGASKRRYNFIRDSGSCDYCKKVFLSTSTSAQCSLLVPSSICGHTCTTKDSICAGPSVYFWRHREVYAAKQEDSAPPPGRFYWVCQVTMEHRRDCSLDLTPRPAQWRYSKCSSICCRRLWVGNIYGHME